MLVAALASFLVIIGCLLVVLWHREPDSRPPIDPPKAEQPIPEPAPCRQPISENEAASAPKGSFQWPKLTRHDSADRCKEDELIRAAELAKRNVMRNAAARAALTPRSSPEQPKLKRFDSADHFKGEELVRAAELAKHNVTRNAAARAALAPSSSLQLPKLKRFDSADHFMKDELTRAAELATRGAAANGMAAAVASYPRALSPRSVHDPLRERRVMTGSRLNPAYTAERS